MNHTSELKATWEISLLFYYSCYRILLNLKSTLLPWQWKALKSYSGYIICHLISISKCVWLNIIHSITINIFVQLNAFRYWFGWVCFCFCFCFFPLDSIVLYWIFNCIFTIFTKLLFCKNPTNLGNFMTVKGIFLHFHIW